MTDTPNIPPPPPMQFVPPAPPPPPLASVPPMPGASIVQLAAAAKKVDTRKASEKKYGKPVMDLGFCIVPSLLMWELCWNLGDGGLREAAYRGG